MIAGATMLFAMSIPLVQKNVSAGLRGDFVTNSEGDTIIGYEGTGGSITIPDGIKSIGAEAFKGSGVTAVDLNEVTVIGNSAFAESRLSVVSGINGVSAIGGLAFAKTDISAFAVPKSLSRLASDAFDGTKALTGFSGGSTIYPIYGGCIYSDRGKTLYVVPKGLEDSVTVWKKATAIAPGALKGCNGVKDIYIPATIREIGVVENAADGKIVSALPSKSTVYGYKGSVAQKYAKKTGVNFVSVGEIDGAAAEAEEIAFEDDIDADPYIEIADTEDPDEQILQAAANGTASAELNEPVVIAEAGESDVIAEPYASASETDIVTNTNSNTSKKTKSSSSSVVYTESTPNSYSNERDSSYYVAYNSTDSDFVYYDELAEEYDGTSASGKRGSEVAARIVVPDETPITSNQSSSTGTTSDALPIEGGTTSNSTTNNTAGSTTDSTSTPQTVSDNGQNQTTVPTTPQTVSDNGQNSTANTGDAQEVTTTLTADNNTQQNTNQYTTNNNASALASRALDATPKTADLSIGAPFIFAGGLFMAGFSGMILTRRRKVPVLSMQEDRTSDELD